MRILVTLHSYLPLISGAELHTHWLVQKLAESNHVLIFAREINPSANEYEERDTTSGRVRVRLINITRNPFWAYYRDSKVEDRFVRLLREFNPDIILLAHTVGLSASIVDAAARSDIPTVVQLRDFFYMCHRLSLFKSDLSLCAGPGDGSRCKECMAHDMWEMDVGPSESPGIERTRYMKDVLGKASLIFGHSDFLVEKHVEFGVPRHKIRVISGGIELDAIARSYARRASSRLRFGYFGAISPMKGVDTIVQAFVRGRSDNAELHLFGGADSAFESWLRRFVDGKRVYFHGKYSREQLGCVLSKIDVFVHASVVHEHYPLTIREAFAARLPVIVSNLRAQCDAVRDGVDGLHFKAGFSEDLQAKMESLVCSPTKLNNFRKNILPVRSIGEEALELESVFTELVRE